MNKVILMGRLTKDPEVRVPNETEVAYFSLAVPRKFSRDGEPDADFFNCVAFGRLAVVAEKYLFKGTKIMLSGRIQNNNYKNRDGQMVYSVQVLAEEIEFAESKSASAGNQGPASQPVDENGFLNFGDCNDEDLPFN